MIKNKKLLIVLLAIFIFVQVTLGVLLQTSQDKFCINLRYTAVILACLFCILFASKTLSFAFTQIALVFTVCADYFLVYIPEIKQLPAMIFFSMAQIAYFLRLYFEDGDQKRKKVHLIIRASSSLIILIITLAVLGKSCDALALVSMFYYANLVLNAVFAFIGFGKNPILPIAFTLFILCDTVIGLGVLRAYMPGLEGAFIYKLIHPGFDLAWAFYLPSQALLAISLLPHYFKRS